MKYAIPFAAPTLQDAPRVREAVRLSHAMVNDLSFANLYLLQNKYQTKIAFVRECLIRYFEGEARFKGYTFPIGNESSIIEALKAIEKDAETRNRPLHFSALTIEQVAYLEHRYGNCSTWNNDRGDADYLYKRTDLAHLPGTKYHKKRNHIARFSKEHKDWCYREIRTNQKEDALLVAKGWMEGMEQSASLIHEAQAIEHALENFEVLSMTGGIIYINKKPVAMSLASPISPDVMDIHYEKCLPDYRDAYPIINRELARHLDCTYINREEDLNISGLRQAKLSYHPDQIISRLSGTIC